MANTTKNGNQSTTQEYLCTTGIYQKIFLITLCILLSNMTFLGNVLIIIVLTKVTSIHPIQTIVTLPWGHRPWCGSYYPASTHWLYNVPKTL